MVIITKNKNESKTALCEYEKNTGSKSKLMSINMFKTLYPRTSIADLNKCEGTKAVLLNYNNSCIPLLVVCKVSIINKSIRF